MIFTLHVHLLHIWHLQLEIILTLPAYSAITYCPTVEYANRYSIQVQMHALNMPPSLAYRRQ